MFVDHDIGGFEIQGLRTNSKRLIATTLLDYEHWFMMHLHAMDIRSQT